MRLVARIANRALDLLYLRGSERLWAHALRGRVLSLLYHRVDEPGRFPWLARHGPPVISPRDLEIDLRFWQRLGARFATFRDLRDGWFPAPHEVGVVVCFDDGFKDNYTLGLEVLTRLGIPATIFQVSGLVGATELIWEHEIGFRQRDPERAQRFRRLAETIVTEELGMGPAERSLDDALRFGLSGAAVERLLRQAAAGDEDGESGQNVAAARDLYPVADDLARATAAGIEVASHGASHQPRSRFDEAGFEVDLQTSRARLEELTGSAPEAYSYPFGMHRPGDDAICRRHYRQAAIVAPRPIDRGCSPWCLPRATWPGPARNGLRRRRWLLRGHI